MKTIRNHHGEQVDPRDAIDENATARLSRAGRDLERTAGYGGPRVDEYGSDRDGGYWPSLDGGLDPWRSA